VIANPKIVLATWGSLGDLHPFIAVAKELRQQDFEPVIASLNEYRATVQSEGIGFHPLRPSFEDIERDLGISLFELTHQIIAKPQLVYEKLVFPFLRQSYEDMLSATTHAALVVTSSVPIAARLAAEKRGIARIAAVLQPMMFMSAYDPPVMLPGAWLAPLLRRLGPTNAGFVLRAIKRMLGRLATPVQQFRREIGLSATNKDPIIDGQFSSAGTLAMYSALLGGLQADFPPRTSITGFAFYDSHNGAADLDPSIATFLASGSRPMVFTLGSSMVRDPGNFYRESVAAVRRLNRRAVLLVGDGPREECNDLASCDVLVCTYAPYSQLFPLAELIVHQGGIGTLAQALRAGRPQLIIPFFADQADNAARAVRLGVARTMARSRYNAMRACHAITALLEDTSYASNALTVREHMARENGAEAAARVLGAHARGTAH
jgi:rhamnosyltransferase subunit B